MNKIRVVNNVIIPYDDTDVNINDNEIIFVNSGNYVIEYIDSTDISLNIKVNEGVCVYLFEYSNNSKIIVNNRYDIFGNLIIGKFYANGSTNEVIDIYLNKEKASVKYSFSSIGKGDDRYTIDIHHLFENTSSDIFNRTIAMEGSSNIFDINSYVDNGILNTYLNQQTRIVTLGDSNNRINPNMFIGENSTTGIHSSTIGTISEEDIFYLMSRGISYDTAINLIIKGMIISNINPNMEYREKILDILSKEVNT